MRPALVLLLLIAPFVGGCLSSPDVTPAADGPQAGTPPPSATPTPAPPADGGAPQTGQSATPSNEEAPEPILTVVPVSWSGMLAPGACIPVGPGGCFGLTLTPSDRWHELETPGVPVAAELTLTWSASSPLTERLSFVLLASRSCGNGCTEGRGLGPPVVGPSPLTLTTTEILLEEDEVLDVYVTIESLTPDPVYSHASTGQSFQVEGTVTALVPA